jgi:iron-sulfur cluster repair protein YtfE (RIC family)
MDTTTRTRNAQKTQDAVALLVAQHREVKDLFKKFEELGDRAFASKKKLADQICAELSKHAAIEEEIFYPAVRAKAEEGEEMVDEAVVEHASAKDLIAQLQEMTAEEDLFDAKVKVLSEQIDHHVEEEEKEMFKNAKKAGLDLADLGERMQARYEEMSARGM